MKMPEEKKPSKEYTFSLNEQEANFIVDCINAAPLNGQQSMFRITLIGKMNEQYTKQKNEDG